MKLPEPYLKAMAALDAVVSFVEAKDIRDKAIAMEVYALHAKDADLASKAVEAKKRAERKIGQLIAIDREAGRLAKGGGDQRSDHRGARDPGDPKTLEDQGVDKNLAKRAREAWAMTEPEFQAYVEKYCKRAIAAAEGDREAIREARVEVQREKKARRQVREVELGSKQQALPEKKYGVILADPEWRFEVWSRDTGMDRSADNHYPTSVAAVIAARDVPSIAANDCALFLWATVPMMPQALMVMSAWGFDYRSHFVWVKDKFGTGYWNRNRHEILLLGIRGSPPCPSPGDQWESVLEARTMVHSEKPALFYKLIEAYFPHLPKIELNARQRRDGWDAWGFEAPAEVVEVEIVTR
jgi:N6-adenosine-specific RNA methylase IME4